MRCLLLPDPAFPVYLLLLLPATADQLAAALELQPGEFAARYGFPRPVAGDMLVLHSRTSCRASWAAQVAADAGLHRCGL